MNGAAAAGGTPRSAPPAAKPVVLHLKHTWLPLSETFVYEVVRNHRRYEPKVLALSAENLQQFPVASLTTAAPGGFLSGWLDRAGLRLNRRRPATEAALLRAAAPLQPDVVHAHFGTFGWHALPIRRRLGVPLVTTFYGGDLFARARDPKWLSAYRTLFAEGDAFLVEGEEMGKALRSFGCPPGKIGVQPIGFDAPRFLRRPPPPPAAGEPVRILMCGRFVEKKGFEYGLRGFAIARRRDPRLRLRLIGDGPLRPALERLCTELGLVDAVSLPGYLTHGEYRREAEAAHLFLAPSVLAADGDSEGGAPTVLLEMQALGLPIVATRHADIPHVVEEGKSALLVPERDADAIGAALLELAGRPERWPEMGAAGQAFVGERHDSRRLAVRLEERYDELIAARGAAR